MSTLHALPVPLPSTCITLGQITTDPLGASSTSIKPSVSPDSVQNAHQSMKEDTEAISQTTINEPSQVFDSLRHENTIQDFLRKISHQNKPIYFVTGLQTSRSSSHKRADAEHEPIAEDASTPQPQLLPFRRVDSASNMAPSHSPARSQSGEAVLAVQLHKVKCRIGAVNEPHPISDLDYIWSYHSLEGEEEDLQLSLGLGKALESHEFKTLAGITEKQEAKDANHSWSYDYEDSDDGLGGF